MHKLSNSEIDFVRSQIVTSRKGYKEVATQEDFDKF